LLVAVAVVQITLVVAVLVVFCTIHHLALFQERITQ
jgi:hypothetical protein